MTFLRKILRLGHDYDKIEHDASKLQKKLEVFILKYLEVTIFVIAVNIVNASCTYRLKPYGYHIRFKIISNHDSSIPSK